MDLPQIALGAGMLAASGAMLSVAGRPGASVPLGLAALAALGLVAAAITGVVSTRRRLRQ